MTYHVPAQKNEIKNLNVIDYLVEILPEKDKLYFRESFSLFNAPEYENFYTRAHSGVLDQLGKPDSLAGLKTKTIEDTISSGNYKAALDMVRKFRPEMKREFEFILRVILRYPYTIED